MRRLAASPPRRSRVPEKYLRAPEPGRIQGNVSWFLPSVLGLRRRREFTVRHRAAGILVAVALLLPVHFSFGAGTDYRLGDVATEDVVTPVPLLVVNPVATEALKQKIAEQIPVVVRFTPQSANE